MAVPHSGLPTRLGHYQVIEQIGAGGMGVVYLAHDERLDRDVALKVLPAGALADDAARKLFRKEALALSKLNHPNIATIHDFDTDSGTDFLVCEYIPGAGLDESLELVPFTEKIVARLALQLCEGLAAAHAQGVIHRDLKPANVRLTPDMRVKILDFGLAKIVRPAIDEGATASVSETKAFAGTLPYMAPEQLRGERVDARTDIWAVGAVLYEMCTGRRVFGGAAGTQLVASILEQAPEPPRAHNRRISPALENIILRCLAKNPDERYQSVTELAVDLRCVDAVTTPLTRPQRMPERKRWRRWVMAPLLLVVLAALALLGYGVYRRFAPVLTEKDYLLVADFANTTGEPVFDKTLRKAMALDLGQSPYLNVVSDQQLAQALGLMGRRPEEELTVPLATELCQRKGYKALLTGNLGSIGNDYVLSVSVLNAVTGEVLASDRQQIARNEQPLRMVDRAASNLRKRLGESLASVQKFEIPLPDATTSKLEALKAFALGDAKHFAGYEIEAIGLYKRALEVDPNFALAWARVAVAYSNLADAPDADDAWKHAFALRDRVKLERERLYILSQSPDLTERRAAMELYRATYPRDAIPWINLSEIDPDPQGEHDLRQAIALDPTMAPAYGDLASLYATRGRMADAVQVCRDGLGHARGPRLAAQCYDVALSAHDDAALNEITGVLKESAEGRLELTELERDLGFARGQVQHANQIDQQLREALDKTNLPNLALSQALPHVRMQLAAGYEVAVSRLLQSYSGSAAHSPVALAALAEAGETAALARARGQAADRAAFVYADALLAYRAGRWAQALSGLRNPAVAEDEFVLWYRGSAALRANQAEPAKADFEKLAIVDPSSPLWPWAPFAHIGLARCSVQQRNAPQARAEYEKAFQAWRGADADIPLLRQARAEYARLPK